MAYNFNPFTGNLDIVSVDTTDIGDTIGNSPSSDGIMYVDSSGLLKNDLLNIDQKSLFGGLVTTTELYSTTEPSSPAMMFLDATAAGGADAMGVGFSGSGTQAFYLGINLSTLSALGQLQYDPANSANSNFTIALTGLGGTSELAVTTGAVDMQVPLDMNSNLINNVTDPVSAQDAATKNYVDSIEGTAILSTGETGGTKFLREDGDGTSSWQTVSASPAGSNQQIQYNNSGSFGASSTFLFDGTNLVIGDTAAEANLHIKDSATFDATTDAFMIELPNMPSSQNAFKAVKIRADGTMKLQDRYNDAPGEVGLHINYINQDVDLLVGRNGSNIAAGVGAAIAFEKTGTFDFTGSIRGGVVGGALMTNNNYTAATQGIASYNNDNYTATTKNMAGLRGIARPKPALQSSGTNGARSNFSGVEGIADQTWGTDNTNAYAIGGRFQATNGEFNWGIWVESGIGYFEENVGIGTSTPTAWLHLAGGTTTNPPLKLTDGDLLTTPEDGAIEYDDNTLYYTGLGKRRALDRTNDVVTSTTTVANTVTETTVFTSTVEADDLKAGNVLKIFTSGIISNATASDDITINVYIGSTQVQTYNPAIGNVSSADWHTVTQLAVRSIGASGSVAVHSEEYIDANINYTNSLETIDTTTSENITVKVQWDNAKAGNTISLYQGHMEIKN